MKKHIKALKIGAFCLATVLTLGLIILANLFLGNPLSRLMAYNAGKKYIAENLSGDGYKIEYVNYNWKDGGGYSVRLGSDKLIDGGFYIAVDMLGRVKYDYSYIVSNGTNTAYRLNNEYDESLNYVVSHTDLPFKDCDVWGRLMFREEIPIDSPLEGIDDIPISSLKVNGLYNVQDFGAKIGVVTVYILGEDVISCEDAAEYLLKFKESCDSFGVKFHSIGFTGNLSFKGLKYEDIYADGLPERIKALIREQKKQGLRIRRRPCYYCLSNFTRCHRRFPGLRRTALPCALAL